MLSPEVCRFPAPRVTRSVLLRAQSADVATAARTHLYYHTIAVVCPDEYKIPDSLSGVVSHDSDFYKLSSCPASELINKQFVEHFIGNGSVNALSVNAHCDIDNCLAITEDGILVLHVANQLYQELGLEGTKSSKNFTEICIDLKSDNFKNNKHYNKLQSSVQKVGTFDLLIKWKPHSGNICPSSIAKYFYDRNVEVKTSVTRAYVTIRELESVPSLRTEQLGEAVEWVGAVALGADLHPSQPYLSTYLEPTQEGDVVAAQATVLVAKGFFTPDTIINLHTEIEKYVTSRDEAHWAALTYQCFTDTPCGAQPHIKFQAVDATYTIFTHNAGNIIHKSITVK